jgi:alanyl-tRNA synthetase
MGVERTVAILNNLEDNYETEMWKPIIQEIEHLSNKKYSENKIEMRIIADHIKAACFIIDDGIVPGNSEQGYVLRRLIRGAIRYSKSLEFSEIASIAKEVFKIYPEYKLNKKLIIEELNKEEEKFEKTLEKGLNKFYKFTNKKKELTGKESFMLYQSYGFPIEMIEELSKENKISFNKKEFYAEQNKHKKLSQTASAGKFKSGLADNSEKTTRLHTAAHLLLAALRKVLKDEKILQKGSNITAERLRLDFSFDRKLTDEEIKEVEDLINSEIQKGTGIVREEMHPDKAKEEGAIGNFNEKYGNLVSVYTIGEFSKEICTGPHVKSIKEIKSFKIKKQQSSGAGVRRIKAIIE